MLTPDMQVDQAQFNSTMVTYVQKLIETLWLTERKKFPKFMEQHKKAREDLEVKVNELQDKF